MAQLCQMTSEQNRGQATVALIFSAECVSVFHQRRLKGNWSRCCDSNIWISAVYRSPASVARSQWQSCPIPIKRLRRQSLPSDCPLTRWQSRNSGTKPAKASPTLPLPSMPSSLQCNPDRRMQQMRDSPWHAAPLLYHQSQLPSQTWCHWLLVDTREHNAPCFWLISNLIPNTSGAHRGTLLFGFGNINQN